MNYKFEVLKAKKDMLLIKRRISKNNRYKFHITPTINNNIVDCSIYQSNDVLTISSIFQSK